MTDQHLVNALVNAANALIAYNRDRILDFDQAALGGALAAAVTALDSGNPDRLAAAKRHVDARVFERLKETCRFKPGSKTFEDRALDFYVGAAVGAEAAGDRALCEHLSRIAMMVIAIQGISGLTQS